MRLRPRKVKVLWGLGYNATGVPTSPWGVTVAAASIPRKTHFHCQLEWGILRHSAGNIVSHVSVGTLPGRIN